MSRKVQRPSVEENRHTSNPKASTDPETRIVAMGGQRVGREREKEEGGLTVRTS